MSTDRPNATAAVGMIGGGQLARMTQQAAIALGVRLHVLTPLETDPAIAAGAEWVEGDPNDLDAMRRLADRVDVVTFDHELVPASNVEALEADAVVVRPGSGALAHAQDKLHARRSFAGAGFPVPDWLEIDRADDLDEFASAVGWPVVLKAVTGGYDGRGVVVAHDPAEGRAVIAEGHWVAERFVAIDLELAVVVARRPGGEVEVYPVVETVQIDGICRELVMPGRLDPDIAARATSLALDVVDHIDGVGIVAVEMFVSDDDLLVNEVATRPHNSGHATIEGSVTSQFENHLRAVLDWPLGSTGMTGGAAAMVNVLGDGGDRFRTSAVRLASHDGVHVHFYGKTDRPGRKIGHLTVVDDNADTALARARRAGREVMDDV